ncbi:MAG: hypothetical protein IPN33_21050 [Saprospiraceae bacterium]|nr:hypothetical protein [Saprospiraceae bacterium]
MRIKGWLFLVKGGSVALDCFARESLEKMIEHRALELAQEIVMKTSHTMHLENQEIDKTAIDNAIRKRAEKIKNELPKSLWN